MNDNRPIKVFREEDLRETPPKDIFNYNIEKPVEWAVNVYARTDNTKKADETYWEMCKLARDLRPKLLDHVGVSCYRITEEDEKPDTDEPMTEFHDENTLVKVRTALLDAGLDGIQADDAIRSMQNYGILFRERNV